MEIKSAVLGAIIATVLILGYIAYDTQRTVEQIKKDTEHIKLILDNSQID